MTFDQIAGSKRLFLGALAALCLLLLAPLLVVDVPPLVDYPNHLARVTVLAALPGDPVIARFYATRWAVIPNLALDLIGPPLLRVFPVHVAGRILIAIAVLMPVLGCVAYGAALRRRCWWSLAVGLIAYNRTLLEGFLNFNMAIGLALLLAAAWTRWRSQYPTLMIGVAVLGAVALFVCHLMALLMFGVLIAADELVRIWSLRMRPRVVLASGARLALIFTAPLALYACSGLPGLGDDAIFLGVGAKLNQLLAAFMNYVGPLDALTALFALAAPALCLLLGAATCGAAGPGRGHRHARGISRRALRVEGDVPDRHPIRDHAWGAVVCWLYSGTLAGLAEGRRNDRGGCAAAGADGGADGGLERPSRRSR